MGGDSWRKYFRRKNFTYADALHILDNSEHIRAATAVIYTGGKVIKHKDKKTAPSVFVIGTMGDYMATESKEHLDSLHEPLSKVTKHLTCHGLGTAGIFNTALVHT